MFEEITSQCFKCKVPRCSQHCPVSTPIPDIIRLVETGELSKAGDILFQNNPLSAICSVVCPHERNCVGNCIRGIKGDPCEFFRIEQAVSRDYLMNHLPEKPESNGKSVAVIGGGPAGITASIILAKKGFSVTLMEARDKIGGILRYGIPDFRLPRDLVDRYDVILRALGVKIKPNTFVGSTTTLDDMFVDGYSAIFIAVGTAKPNRLGLLGETLGCAHYAIDYLKTPDAYVLGKKVVVIGAGNVAVDAARMAKRNGGTDISVTVINNRRPEDMTGNLHEIADAQREGVQFLHLLQTVKIFDGGIRCAAVLPVEGDGTIHYEEDFSQISEIPADTVILAIGQGPQNAVTSHADVAKTGRGLLDADENGRTSMPGVFAAGDIVTGPQTVVQAVSCAKRTAEEIVEYVYSKK